MGARISKRIKTRETGDKLKFYIEGQYSAGKTSLLYRLALGKLVPTTHTYDSHLETCSFDGIEIDGWDVGGRHKIHAFQKMYYELSDAIVYVIDSADNDRLDDAFEELTQCILQDEALENMVVMVLANKQDLENSMGPEEIEAKLLKECRKKIRFNMTVFVMPCSVKSGEGIPEAFSKFAQMVKDKKIKKKSLVPSGFIPQAWLSVPENKDPQSVPDNKEPQSVPDNKEPQLNNNETLQELTDKEKMDLGKIQSEFILNALISNKESENEDNIDFSNSEKDDSKNLHKIKNWFKNPFTSFKSVLFY